MRLYFTPHNLCLPICKKCDQVIERYGLVDKQSNHWHPNCYEQKVHDKLVVAEESFKIIISHTQDNNSAANSVAQRALQRITE